MNSSEAVDALEEPRPPRTEEKRTADPATDRSMSVDEIQDAYAEYAKWIDRFEWLDRLMTGRYRRRQFSNATGRVLEVACGTGTNFRYLPESVDLVAVDISPEMLERAREELDRLGRDGTLERMDAQELEFEDDSFRTVISSFSTCTFPDPVAALREMARVCEPGGRILLVEHGRSDVGLVARYQEWRTDAHYEKAGCRVTQDPLAVVRRAGLDVETTDTGQFGRITALACSVPEDSSRREEKR